MGRDGDGHTLAQCIAMTQQQDTAGGGSARQSAAPSHQSTRAMAQEHGLRCSLALEMAARQLSVRALSEATGINTAAIVRLRRNQFSQLDAGVVERICRFLQINPGELIHLDPPLEKDQPQAIAPIPEP